MIVLILEYKKYIIKYIIMTKMNRRKFLTLASAVPLGFNFFKHSPSDIVSKDYPDEHFDPWIEIDTKNLAWNVSQIRKAVDNRPIMAVVKANAYGHGAVEAAKSLEKQNIKHFAVAKVQEAVSLRDNGIKSTILNFGPFTQKEAEQVVQLGISQSVYSETVELLAKAARKYGKQARVHIKVDSGLGRVGVPYYEAMIFIEKVASMPDIVIEGIFTTFTEKREFDKVQLERLLQVCDEAKKKGISVGVRHAASSASIPDFPESFLDMVRPGNKILGMSSSRSMEIKPVMSLKTRVVYVKKIRPGDSVGYGRSFITDKETLVGTIPIGHTDGYPPRARKNAQVLIHGWRWPLIASISANNMTVDITGSEGIKIGVEVVLIGSQNGEEIKLGEVGRWSESGSYNVAGRMNPLLPRVCV